jgi:acetolactate decarboxylase
VTTPLSPGAVSQFAVLDALLGGVYSQGIAARDVRALGDTGIGCCEGLGGEVILIDGELLECTADGPPRRMDDDEVLPFANVCTVGPSSTVPAVRGDLAALGALVEQRLRRRNLFHAVRWDGTVDRIRTRVTRRQSPPLRPLADVAAEQIETDTVAVEGSLVGFWMPRIYQGITVAGLHLHFISADRTVGGHVLRADLGPGVLRMTAFADFHLRVPTDDRFLATELSHDDDHRIVAVENGE